MDQSSKRPLLIMIAGITGAGKTTFASLASGQELAIGHGLNPCTQDPQAVGFVLDNRQVILIDTPGFDDTNRNDVEILADIAKWMSKEGFLKDQQTLDGFIFLHPIHEVDQLQGGLEKKRTRLIQKILGKDAYKRVVIATTMWDTVNERYHDKIEQDLGLRAVNGVWNEFCRGGAIVTRHYNSEESAHSIIRSIVERSKKADNDEILLQKEIATSRFAETSVGRELRDHLEAEIDAIMDQLLQHRQQRPPDSYRRSRIAVQRREWKHWDEENQNLTEDLQLRQAHLKKLNSFTVSIPSTFSSLQAYLLLTSHPSFGSFSFGGGCLDSKKDSQYWMLLKVVLHRRKTSSVR
jgi:predicted GTPase